MTHSCKRKHRIGTTLTLPVLTLAAVAAVNSTAAQTIPTEEIVVIGTRTAVNINDLPMQVSVISAADIDNSGATNITEILADSGEIYIRTSGSSGGRITLRGMAHADTLFLLDGMRINGELNKTYELDRIPAGMIDRIEVVKGSASLLYGSEAMGGWSTSSPDATRTALVATCSCCMEPIATVWT